MLFAAVFSLFGWMPLVMQWLCGGVVALFLIFVVLSVIALLKDVIPFL